MSSPSGSPDVGGIDRILRRRAGKAPEKSNFAETCTLLSQYLKERGAHAMAGKFEAVSKGRSEVSTAAPTTSMNLLPNIVRPDLNVEPSVDFFTKLASSSGSMEDTISKVDLTREPTTNLETAQMTIFYAGQVLVFNDLPVSKAKEIMVLADKQAKSACPETRPSVNKANFSSAVVIESTVMSTTKQHTQANGSDLPIARRASLHRFFSKRKDRAAAVAPYQVNIEPSATDSPPLMKPEESNVFEGQSSKQQIDLNL